MDDEDSYEGWRDEDCHADSDAVYDDDGRHRHNK